MSVIYLHPIGLDGASWQYLEADLLDDATAYTMSWHGDRQQEPGISSLEGMADDVLMNTDGTLDVVGLSLGGAVALQIAFRDPSRVRSLMLACSSAGGNGGQALIERADAAAAAGMTDEIVESHMNRWFSEAALQERDNIGVDYARARLFADDPQVFAANWRALAKNDAVGRLGEIRVPTTVLHAAEDTSSSEEAKRSMTAQIPGARLDVIPGPHMVHLESPREFSAALRRHLDWVNSPL